MPTNKPTVTVTTKEINSEFPGYKEQLHQVMYQCVFAYTGDASFSEEFLVDKCRLVEYEANSMQFIIDGTVVAKISVSNGMFNILSGISSMTMVVETYEQYESVSNEIH